MAGAPLFQLNVNASLPPGLAQIGQSFRGVVAELEGALVIRSSGGTVPIASGSGLVPGQNVNVRVVAGGANPQLQVAPLSVVVGTGSQLASALQQSSISGEIASIGGKLTFVQGKTSVPLPANQSLFTAGDRAVLQSLPGSGGTHAAIVPAAGAPSSALAAQSPQGIPLPPVVNGPQVANQVQQLFAQAGNLGVGIAALQTTLAQPPVAAAIPFDIGQAFAQVFAPLLRPDAEASELTAGLRQWGRSLSTSSESALARNAGLESPDTVLRLVRNDPAFRQLLAERGELRAFDAMADRVLDRLGGGHLQQLRGVDQPYWFLEFPFDPAAGIERALVHFFRDGNKAESGSEPESQTVVLDLALTQLGEVWVKLSIVNGQCTCHISVTDDDVLALVHEFQDELAEGLASTGAERVSVQAALWDGNRIDRTGAMLTAMDGVDMTA